MIAPRHTPSLRTIFREKERSFDQLYESESSAVFKSRRIRHSPMNRVDWQARECWRGWSSHAFQFVGQLSRLILCRLASWHGVRGRGKSVLTASAKPTRQIKTFRRSTCITCSCTTWVAKIQKPHSSRWQRRWPRQLVRRRDTTNSWNVSFSRVSYSLARTVRID